MNAQSELMSMRSYAKSRGMALSTLQHHIKKGTIKKIDGKIDPEYTDIKLRESIDIKQSERGSVQRLFHGRALDGGPLSPEQNGLGISHWRVKREEMEYRKLELAVLEAEGKLVDAKAVRQTQFELARQLRDAIMAVPARTAELLAAEKSAVEIEKLLTTELRQALSDVVSEVECAEELPEAEPDEEGEEE